jgi:heat shock protein HtpX
VVLFIVTNLAVVLVLGISLRLLGVERLLVERGVGLNLWALLIFCAILGFAGSLISLALSKWMALRFTGAELIEKPRNETEAWLLATVEGLARRTGIGMPDVAVYPGREPNAFATGARRDSALVAVSAGLIDRLRRPEIEAVLGHEIAHVANGDMVTMTLLQGVLNTFVLFLSRVIGYTVDRVVFRAERDHGPGFWLTLIATQVVLGFLASLIVLWFSRRRELRADGGSADLLGPAPMIAALSRLKAVREPTELPDALRTFGIRGGEQAHGGIARLLLSHPPIDERIAALEARAAGAGRA